MTRCQDSKCCIYSRKSNILKFVCKAFAPIFILSLLNATALGVPTVSIISPRQRETVSVRQIKVEVIISGFPVGSDGTASELFINEILAVRMDKERTVLLVPVHDGFHQVKAYLRNASRTVAESELIHVLVDAESAEQQPAARPWIAEEPGRVSVVIASHDRFDSLLDSIESVRQQTHQDWEIIVVNDASTDPRYYALIEDVTMIHLPYNVGRPGLVRNAGIAVASGEWVAVLDDDDVWLPTKLERQLEALRRTGLNMSSTEAYAGNGTHVPGRPYMWWLRDAHGPYAVHRSMRTLREFGAWGESDATGVAEAVASGRCVQPDYCLPDTWDRFVIQLANFVITSSVLVRRETLLGAGPFNNRTLGEDHDLWKAVLGLGRGARSAFVRDPLVYWRADGPAKLTQSWRT